MMIDKIAKPQREHMGTNPDGVKGQSRNEAKATANSKFLISLRVHITIHRRRAGKSFLFLDLQRLSVLCTCWQDWRAGRR